MPVHRLVPRTDIQFVSTNKPFSCFDFIEKNYGNFVTLRRLFSLARSHEFRTLTIENISAKGMIEEENKEISRLFPEYSMKGLQRIAFWDIPFRKTDEIKKLKNSNLIGYAIVKLDFSKKRGIRWHVFESVIRKYDHEHNCIPNPRNYKVKIAGKQFTAHGVMYCQQNGLNKACAQVALRALIDGLPGIGNISFGTINQLAGNTSEPGEGLSLPQIQNVLHGLDIPFRDIDYSQGEKGNKKNPMRKSHPYRKFIYSGAENGIGALMGFRRKIPRVPKKKQPRHIIPFFGHTFNKDSWVPDAALYYFEIGRDIRYIPSDNWTSSFIGNDDNFGSDFCVPKLYTKRDQVDYVVELLEKTSGEKVDEKYIDVKSTKLNYEDEYRLMLEDIADKCADFLLQLESPVEQGFNPEEEVDEPTLAQRLYFLRNLLGSEDFQLAVHRIVTMPNTRWCEELRSIKTAQSGRLGKYEVKQLAKGNRRVELPGNHPLRRIMPSVPEEIEIRNKRDTVDTPENRFVKHALSVFLQTLEDMIAKFAELNSGKYPGLTDEINERINWLEETLSHSVFKEVSPLSLLPLNSPILQRKEGYRQVLRSWMLFDLAARLSWEGGDDVYGAGKRNAAVLYEYWVFFKLLEIVSASFNLDNPPVKDLINDKDLMLKLKSGKRMPIKGYCETSGRRLRVEFSYNRTFSGVDNYPQGGSWTRQMRPDYSLSLWPAEFSQDEAEEQELITHVHFDAKYKVDNLVEIMGEEPENIEEEEKILNEEKEQQRSGNYKRGDLLKMHAYRDAIRRSAGAYVLYPGYDDPTTRFQGFHELLPGLGAFPLRPGTADDGTAALSNFLEEITEHVCNRATQREQHSFHTYRIHNSSQPELHEAFPEKEYGSDKRSLPPAETFVLHGWHSGKENLDWITESGYYNYRTEDKRGSLRLEESVANASYILLHGEGEYRNATRLFRITKRGPRVFSKEKLIEGGYPGAASQPYYIVYDVKPLENDDPLNFYSWDLSELDDIPTGRASAIPKAIPFNEFMKAAKKNNDN